MATALPLGLSVEAWGRLDDAIEGELVDGRLEGEEVPSGIHETVVMWFAMLLHAHFRARGGYVFGSGIKLAIRAARGRIPDVVCFPADRRPESTGVVKAVPEVVVEVISPEPSDHRRDRVDKLRDYEALGVPFYWLVDPHARIFEIWALEGRGYARAIIASGGAVDPTPGCEGLVVDLDALWAEVDRLAEP
jgi:Uma2 family endonuclease